MEAREASRRLFGGGVAGDALPSTELEPAELAAGIPAPDLFFRVGLCSSRADARRLIQQGGAYVNDVPVAGVDDCITAEHLQDGAILLRAGKKRYHRVIAK